MKSLCAWMMLSSAAWAEPRIAYLFSTGKPGVCEVAPIKGKADRTFPKCDDPALSPDGQSLVVTVNTKAGRRLELIDLAGGKRSRLPAEAREVYGAMWSPKGDWIAFNLLREHWGIGVMHPDGTGFRLLQEKPAAHGEAFLAGWDLHTNAPLAQDLETLWEIAPEGSVAWRRPLKPLVGTDSIASDCRFWVAADGETLIGNVEVDRDEIAHLDGPSSYLVKANLKSGRHERLSPKGLSALNPVLAPEGSAVVFDGFTARDVKPGKEGDYSVKTRIYRLPLAGGQPEVLVENATRPTVSR